MKIFLISILFLVVSNSIDVFSQTIPKTLQFSGLTWIIKDGGPRGPGNNYWSDDPTNVWIDSLGQLHLKIRKSPNDNNWYCSEIYTTQSYGYGDYIFYLATNVDSLEDNTVVGLFTYEDDVVSPANINRSSSSNVSRIQSSGKVIEEKNSHTIHNNKNSNSQNAMTGSISILSPNGTIDPWPVRSSRWITWTQNPLEHVKIDLYKADVFYSNIIQSYLSVSATDTGSYKWLIPTDLTPGADYKIKITSLIDNNINDVSDSNFTICISREIDIEFSRWNEPNRPVGLYTVNPVTDHSQNMFNLNLTGTYSTHKFIWSASGINFWSYHGHYPILPDPNLLINQWTYTDEYPNPGTNIPPPGNETLNINFWLVGGLAHLNQQEAEVIITSVHVPPFITLSAPNGGESWLAGTTVTIRWTDNHSEHVKIELFKGGAYYSTISDSTANTGTHSWSIPIDQPPGLDYMVKITSIENINIYDFSNEYFSIQAITGYEYWFNNNFQTKISTTLANPNKSINLLLNISVDSVPFGLNVFNIRFRDINNKYSSVNSQNFINLGVNKLTAYEYWFDNLLSNSVLMEVNGQNLDLITGINMGSLSHGLHSFNIRFKSGNDSWSAVQSQHFYNLGDNSIVSYEYWIDNDFPNRKTQNSSGQSLDLITDIEPFMVSNGLHFFNIRFKTSEGIWSCPISSNFFKCDASPYVTNLISKYSYWFDDADTTKIIVNLLAPVNPLDFMDTIPISSLSLGTHRINFQFHDVKGLSSSVLFQSFSVVVTTRGEEYEILTDAKKSFFKVYPNPTTDIVVVELMETGINTEANLTVYSILGEKILHKTIHGESKFQFSLSGLPVGIYMVHVQWGERSEVAKIVKK